MNEESTEEINDSQETLKEPTLKDVLAAIASFKTEVNERFDRIEKRLDAHDAQLEFIRQGLITNSVSFDRLQSTVFSLRADFNEFREDVKRKEFA